MAVRQGIVHDAVGGGDRGGDLVGRGAAGAADRVLRSGITTTGFDAKVRPQDDLFRHVNGGWIAEAKIPAEYGFFGTFMELRDNALKDLRAIIEDAARQEGASSGSEARKIGDLYAAFMDEKKIEELGLEPIRGDLARIDAVKDKAGFLRLMAELQREGAGGLIRLYVAPDARQSDREIVYLSQGGITLPDESYYRDPKFQPIRDAFVAHVAKVFALAGRPGPEAAAKQVMDLETRLARSHWDRVKNRDQTLSYNKKDRAALDALTPGFDWSTYFDATGARDLSEVIVRQPDFFAAMAATYKDVPLETWKTWLAWHVIDSSAPYLNKAIVDEDFDFARKLSGATELPARWKRGVKVVEGALGEAAGKLYVARHFPPEAKARMQQLVKNLIEAYRQDIQDLDWMSPETRKKALEKLAKFTPKIGYPDKWRDYSETGDPRRRPAGQRPPRRRLRGGPRAGQAGQARGPLRMGDDPADDQRLLQSAVQRDRLPGRDPPAAVLRPGRRRRRELRRHRCRHRPRDRPRLRRPGVEV